MLVSDGSSDKTQGGGGPDSGRRQAGFEAVTGPSPSVRARRVRAPGGNRAAFPDIYPSGPSGR
ncbi:hypothetical protein GCM10018780_40830 [Streptomyces lanatus]|nr:hypothetical protein GCM10018780_40830 [Streptomyces lanatus]